MKISTFNFSVYRWENRVYIIVLRFYGIGMLRISFTILHSLEMYSCMCLSTGTNMCILEMLVFHSIRNNENLLYEQTDFKLMMILSRFFYTMHFCTYIRIRNVVIRNIHKCKLLRQTYIYTTCTRTQVSCLHTLCILTYYT